jgi:hypothetical protein
MKVKKNQSNNIFKSKNDAVKGTRKYWLEMLEYDVYHYGLSYELVKEKYSYGMYKHYWLSTKYWKKRFDEGFTYWSQKRQSDIDMGLYRGKVPEAPKTTSSKAESDMVNYFIYGLIGILVLLIIWAIVKKRKK